MQTLWHLEEDEPFGMNASTDYTEW